MKGLLGALFVLLFVGVQAQSFNWTKRYSTERGGIVYELTQSVWDTVNAQSAADTVAIPFPFRTYGEWAGTAWIEIDTLAANADDHAGTFAIQAAAHTTLGGFETCAQTNTDSLAVMNMPSPVAGLGDIVTFLIKGPKAQALAIIADGVIRYKWGITIWPVNQQYIPPPGTSW